MKKKFLLALMVITLAIVAFGAISVFAETYGDLTYTLTDGGITITGCNSSATTITIPDEIDGCPVTSIGDEAFYNCSRLLNITIPDSVTNIGYYAFYDCDSLKSVDLSDSITNIGNGAFYDCDSLITVDIPNNITSIEAETFCSCDSLTSINIPENVTKIGGGAFAWCGSLTQINWNAISVADFSISNSVFEDCGLDNEGISVVFGDNVKTIPAYCFSPYNGSETPSIVSVKIGNSVTTIGYRAFYGCDTMTSVTIGNNVTSVAAEAFAYCSKLKSIIIPNGVTSINNKTFFVVRT